MDRTQGMFQYELHVRIQSIGLDGQQQDYSIAVPQMNGILQIPQFQAGLVNCFNQLADLIVFSCRHGELPRLLLIFMVQKINAYRKYTTQEGFYL
ncbi:MAG: hypothetical protein IPK77_09690 [Cellvibrio sp.]|nr:hypothetical protein [Cellvibrio sp.]